MSRYIELIDKYEIRQNDDPEFDPPSYIWTDNTGELIRCRDCKYCEITECEQAINFELYECGRLEYGYAVDSNDYCSWAEKKVVG